MPEVDNDPEECTGKVSDEDAILLKEQIRARKAEADEEHREFTHSDGTVRRCPYEIATPRTDSFNGNPLICLPSCPDRKSKAWKFGRRQAEQLIASSHIIRHNLTEYGKNAPEARITLYQDTQFEKQVILDADKQWSLIKYLEYVKLFLAEGEQADFGRQLKLFEESDVLKKAVK